ncbi:MAG: ATP synthase F1 subunit delta [Candidatus Nomurabacteria bacterium]|nr:ATP synthase F1 subunit delta [Candidatus Nomurabacteria bacterium]
MTIISNNDIARAVYLVLKGSDLEVLPPLGGKTSKYSKVVRFLFKKRLLSKTSEILSRLGKIINEEEGRTVARVSSAEKLDQQNKIKLEHFLKKRYSAKEVVLSENLDKKLLGGLKIEANNEVIDLSVKNKIEKLQEYLTKSA